MQHGGRTFGAARSGGRRATGPRLRVVALTLLLVLAPIATVLPAFGQADGETPEKQLSAARRALERLGTRIAEAERQADSAELALDEAETLLADVEQVVNDLATEVERQRVAVTDAELRVERLRHRTETLERAFQDRVARRYMQGPDLTFEVLLNAAGAEEAIARTMLLERVLEGDQVDLERLAASRAAVAAETVLLRAEQERLSELLAEQQVVLVDAGQLRDARALAAARAADDVRALAVEQDDLGEEEEALASLVRRRQAEERERQERARRAGTTVSAPSSAGYSWPLCSPVTSEYGARWGRLHRGIDLGARTGAAIGASRGGTVIFAGWQGGYGQLVLVDHGNGVVTAYAHMSRIDIGVGRRVQSGDRLGAVGSTGNSTGPHLHFEVRVNGSAVNPRQYLAGRPC